MFGKDFIKTQEPTNQKIEKTENQIIYHYHSSHGDDFTFTISGSAREKHLKTLQYAFESLIKDEYTLLPSHQIYLIPNAYWNLYKRIPGGKEILTLKRNLSITVNNQPYRFVETNYYFNINKENCGGVYGIYYHDQLLYIGSSTQDLKSRWKEHDTNFRSFSPINKMYQSNYNPDEIEYRSLKTAAEIADLIKVEKISSWLIEFTEYLYIDLLRPLYNIEGKVQPFTFRAKESDIPTSYWELFKEILTSDYYPLFNIDKPQKI